MTKPLEDIGIAITRPYQKDDPLVSRIAGAGGIPIVFPLIAITPVSQSPALTEVLEGLSRYHWIIFISSNAVHYGMPLLLKHQSSVSARIAAIGPATAKCIHAYGEYSVLYPVSQYDSEHLLLLPEFQQIADQTILIVRGKGGRETLKTTLEQRGATVHYAECYQRSNPQSDSRELEQAAQDNRLHGLIITSTEALRNLLAVSHDLEWLRTQTLFTHHPKIAEAGKPYFKSVVVCRDLEDEAMFACLTAHFHPNQID